MAEVKWIKLMADMFDNSKIRYLRTLPEGNNIVLFWVMLLTKAGKCNSKGFVFLTENIPYTQDMLAAEFGFEKNTVKLALECLCRLNMIQIEKQSIEITNWNEYQNIEGLEKIRTQTRKRVQKFRENQKQLDSNVSCNVTVTQSNATEEEEEEEEDKNKIRIDKYIEKWNSLGLNSVLSIKNNRLKALKARIEEYGEDNVIKAMDNIPKSKFLKGENDRSWRIDIDWLLKPNNFPKVLEGNYTDKPIKTQSKNGNGFNNFEPRAYDYDSLEKKLLGWDKDE